MIIYHINPFSSHPFPWRLRTPMLLVALIDVRSTWCKGKVQRSGAEERLGDVKNVNVST